MVAEHLARHLGAPGMCAFCARVRRRRGPENLVLSSKQYLLRFYNPSPASSLADSGAVRSPGPGRKGASMKKGQSMKYRRELLDAAEVERRVRAIEGFAEREGRMPAATRHGEEEARLRSWFDC